MNDTRIVATVLTALPANSCPVCGRNHRQGSTLLAKHAGLLTALGYTGYDYDREAWVTSAGSSATFNGSRRPANLPGEKHDWVSGQQARCRDELIRLNEEFRQKTGQEYYLYTSRPGDGQTRVVFTDAVCRGYAAGLRHMQAKLALMQN